MSEVEPAELEGRSPHSGDVDKTDLAPPDSTPLIGLSLQTSDRSNANLLSTFATHRALLARSLRYVPHWHSLNSSSHSLMERAQAHVAWLLADALTLVP